MSDPAALRMANLSAYIRGQAEAGTPVRGSVIADALDRLAEELADEDQDRMG